MRKKEIDRDAIFQRPSGAATISGWSIKAVREGCKSGDIPHVKRGTDYLVNMPLWIEQLNAASRGA